MPANEQSLKINFEKLFFPKSIGIIGMGQDPSGGRYFFRCMRNRFKGPIYLFNPRLSGQNFHGYKVFSSILEISDPIDYVILAVPARLCPKLMEEIGKKGVPFTTIFASGFREVGNVELEEEVLTIARKYNVRIIGPNCLGVYNPQAGLYFALEQSGKGGNFSGIFQSGGIAQNLSQLAVSYGLYVSKFISIGNSLDLSPAEFLEYFYNDESTKIIGLYIENL
ncbi:MAG: CoA-binding protein, partial [Promethearchaeota archaeon]